MSFGRTSAIEKHLGIARSITFFSFELGSASQAAIVFYNQDEFTFGNNREFAT